MGYGTRIGSSLECFQNALSQMPRRPQKVRLTSVSAGLSPHGKTGCGTSRDADAPRKRRRTAPLPLPSGSVTNRRAARFATVAGPCRSENAPRAFPETRSRVTSRNPSTPECRFPRHPVFRERCPPRFRTGLSGTVVGTPVVSAENMPRGVPLCFTPKILSSIRPRG